MSDHDDNMQDENERRQIMRDLAERFPMQDGWPTALKAEYMAVVRRFPLATAVRPVYEILMTLRRTMPAPETLARDLQREVDALNRPAKSCRHCDAESPGFVLVYGDTVDRSSGWAPCPWCHPAPLNSHYWRPDTLQRARASGNVHGPLPASVAKLLGQVPA